MANLNNTILESSLHNLRVSHTAMYNSTLPQCDPINNAYNITYQNYTSFYNIWMPMTEGDNTNEYNYKKYMEKYT